jgi:soluble lytic murein transglycosylase
MKFVGRFVLVASAACCAFALPRAVTAQAAPGAQDAVIVQAQEAFRAKNAKQLAQLLPRARGHLLEMWVAYWEQTNRIRDAGFEEFRAFARAYPGAYVTDRLRNDWLLELGRRAVGGDAGAWADFASEIGNFVMRDDPQVDCYNFLRRHLAGEDVIDAAYAHWMRQRGSEGCDAMGEAIVRDGITSGKLSAAQVWQRMRRFFEQDRLAPATRIANYLPGPVDTRILTAVYNDPSKFLLRKPAYTPPSGHSQLNVLALVRLARQSPESAAQWLQQPENLATIAPDDRPYVWGQIGRAAALALDDRAAQWYANTGDADLADEVLMWKVRAALRAGDWKQVLVAVPRMDAEALQDPAWMYWLGRAYAKQGDRASARVLYKAVASPFTFYGKLATEELGQAIALPQPPEPPADEAVAQARARPGIQRALKLFSLDLRSEAVREWNFTLRGQNDAELHATAEVACQAQIWDRCINTSERIKQLPDIRQRFAMPFRDAIRRAAQQQGLDEAYVFGLIRQESRFITDARSAVGASGLMQLMPATARWTAKKAGVSLASGINDVATNVSLGTAYLRLLKDEFDGNEALAAAGYNAGPGRPRKWRNGPLVEAAIFAENVPLAETRDYIKRVLSNATIYAALITGQPQSLKARLGLVGPRTARSAPENDELP